VRRSGALTLYASDGTVAWTVDGGTPGASLVLDERGRLRLVAPDGDVVWEPARYSPGAWPGYRLVVWDNGDLVLRDAAGETAWHSGTARRSDRLDAGQALGEAGQLTSPDGRHSLVVRSTGEVVLLGPDSRPRWSTVTPGATLPDESEETGDQTADETTDESTDETSGQTSDGTTPDAAAVVVEPRLHLAEDGVLTVRDADGAELWRAPGTTAAGSTLVLRDDGDLVLVAPDRRVVWSSGTEIGSSELSVADPLAVGEHLDAPDGHLRLSLTADELALTYDGAEVWTAPVVPGDDATLNVRARGRLALVDGTGDVLWSSPEAAGVVAGSGTALRLDPLGALLTAGTGQELWRVDVPEELVAAPVAPPLDCSLVDGPVPIEETVITKDGVRVHACIAAAVEAMFADARADGVVLGASGWRSRAQQEALRAQNCRSVAGGGVVCHPSTATPGKSRHERGLALDITYGGPAVRYGSPAWEWLVANAERYGLHNLPGEPWHWSIDGS
jgi:D-alanyl-D-alanine carboxypeptidase